MFSDDSQINVPPAFVALFVPPGRIKPTASREEIAQRYELCEDLASALTEQARTILWELGVTEQDVLLRVHGGLAGAASGLSAPEAQWVVRRTAELLEWPQPELPESSEPPAAG